MQQADYNTPYEKEDPGYYDSDFDTDPVDNNVTDEGDGEETARADLGSGWGRIIFAPVRRGRHTEVNVCRSTERDGSEDSFERVIVTKSKNHALQHQAQKSLGDDLWPF
ncbi:hypothetical protein CFOL_v3_12201 [Cephalotus follicularis]|uniref:Uncharacterized protein n=1 Tax=Cephalotus follicularis TaxID=3775 RepID=A0A1Q3BL97_CEPFO|nr:hypothetical protein CFOL_v3_12201 [Cephalotus follicularis]